VKKIVYNRWIVCAAVIATLGICQFCALITIAIKDYRGPAGESYAITEQYLSELGTRNSNVRHHFNRALILLGLTLVPFFMAIPGSDTKDSVWLKLVGLAGATAAMGLIGLGAFPADDGLHRVMLAIWAIPMPLMIICFLFAAANIKARAFLIPCLSVAVIIAIALLVLFSLGDTIVLQKVAVATSLIWFPLVAWFVLKSAYIVVIVQRSTKQILEEEASDYLANITKGHRPDEGRYNDQR